MPHDDLRELVALYALDALPDTEREDVERHLEVCPECTGELAAFRAAAAELAYAAPARRAPEALRDRVLSAIDREAQSAAAAPVTVAPRPQGTNPWWLAAAAVLAAILVGGYALLLKAHIGFLDQELREARAQTSTAQRQLLEVQGQLQHAEFEVRQVRMTAGILAAPDVVKVDLKGPAAASAPIGRAFWSRSRGVLFTANGLPALPGTQVYQLWIVPRAGAPVSGGLLEPDDAGSVLMTAAGNAEQPAAFAVTIEPAGGVPAPTGARVLIGAL